MKALIEPLLQLARFDAEPLQRQKCDLADLTREYVKLLQPLAEAKWLRINLDLQRAPCHAEPPRMKQVITNLLINAILYTPADGTIALRTNAVGDAGFTISDIGLGIAAVQLPHLFERFHRIDASRVRATAGTGLGLAICKAIIDAHGGSILIESAIV